MRNDIESALPNWIEEEYENIRATLAPDKQGDLDTLKKNLSDLKKMHLQSPVKYRIGEIYNITPEDVTRIFKDTFVGLVFACEYTVGYFHFSHISKNKSYLFGFLAALDEGNFLVAMSCLRGITEELAHYAYFARRLKVLREKLYKVSNPPKKKGRPYKKWLERFIADLLEIISLMQRAVQGSGFNWNGWLQELHDQHGVGENSLEFKQIRKTHINDCIRDLAKHSNLPVEKYYSIFSEMVHPNWGSHMLVIDTRIRVDDLRGDLVLSSHPKNIEAAGFFFEVVTTPLANLLAVEMDLLKQTDIIFQSFQQLRTPEQ